MTLRQIVRCSMRHVASGLMAVSLSALLIGSGSGLAFAQERPLLVDGTSAIYQRVLTRPGAELFDTRDGGQLDTYAAFQPLYVYAREGGWSQVGPSVTAGPVGWVDDASVIEWKQNIVASFTNSADRKRQFLFNSEEALRDLMEDEAMRGRQENLLAAAEAGQLTLEDNIVALEPENYVNIQDELYIMPILDYVEDVHPLNYDANLIMQVASVPLREELPQTDGGMASDNFDAGVIFVLDTTRSMGPYIQRTRNALERIVNDIRGTDIGDRVNFGVIGFRDSVEAVPGLEYRTKVLAPLERRADQTELLEAIQQATQVATANSPGFNEDSMAGVEDAIASPSWALEGAERYGGRYVILITDAGPNALDDPLSRSNIGPQQLQRLAEENSVVVMTLHLKTADAGAANHEYAAGQYQQLSRLGTNQFYYPIEGGSEDAFEEAVTRLVTVFTDNVRMARGEATVLTPEETGEELLELGRAMRLAYLGAQEGTQAPQVFDGWISERAIEDPRALAIKPRLLTTKNELATMAELLENILRIGESTREQSGAEDFFDQLQGVIATMAQNPDRLVAADSDDIRGALEFLDHLPYQSQLMIIGSERWSESAVERRNILDGLNQKLVLYRKWLLDPNVWTPLYDDAPDGEWVYAMPFDVLP